VNSQTSTSLITSSIIRGSKFFSRGSTSSSAVEADSALLGPACLNTSPLLHIHTSSSSCGTASAQQVSTTWINPVHVDTSGVRTASNRSRHRQSDTAALATSPLKHPVQTVLHNAFCFYGKCPVYLTNIVRTVTAACSCSGLRSTSSSNFALPHLRSRFAERSFSHALHSCCQEHESVQTRRENSLF